MASSKLHSRKWQQLLRPVNRNGHKSITRLTRRYRHDFLLNVVLPRAGFETPLRVACAEIAPRLTRLIQDTRFSGAHKQRRFNALLQIYTDAATPQAAHP